MGEKTMIPSCRDLARSFSSGEFDSAPWPRKLLLRLHYAACYICRRYVAQLRFLGAAARQSRAVAVEPDQVAGLKARLLERLGER